MALDIDNIFGAKAQSTKDFMITNGQGCYIPAYQRPYSWDKSNVTRLLEDALNGISQLSLRPQSISFLGTIIAIHDTNHKTIKPIYHSEVAQRVMTIIDGQQRICTFTMLNLAMHGFLKDKLSKIEKRKEESAFSWITDQIQQAILELEDTFVIDMRTGEGNYKFYPRIIRAYQDAWSKKENQATYKSPIAKLIWQYFLHIQSSEKGDFKYEPVYQDHEFVDVHNTVKETFKFIQKEIDRICLKKPDDYDFPKLTNLVQTPSFVTSLWNHELPEHVLSYLTESLEDKNYDDYSGILRMLILAKYLNDRTIFTVVTTKNEDDAFDMFEALNTTGEPLTALETFVPKIIEAETIEKYETSISYTHVKTINSYLDRFSRAEERQSATTDMLIPFAISYNSHPLSKKLNDQRRYLRDSFAAIEDDISEKRKFVKSLADISKFMNGGWDIKASEKPDFIGLNIDDEKVITGFKALKDIKHNVVVAPLTRFYREAIYSTEELKDKKIADFEEAIKATVAFSMLWRGAKGGTAGIDSHYKTIMQYGIDGIPALAEKSKKGDVGKVSLTNYKKMLIHFLKEEKINNKQDWVKVASSIPIYKHSSTISRFLLLCASENAILDENNPGLISKGRDGTSSMLNFKTWCDDDYFSVEHIAPQKNNNWDAEIYNEDLQDTLGNLILLPQKENSLIGNREWKYKKLFYDLLAEENLEIFEEKKKNCAGEGLTLSHKAQDILDQASHLKMCKSISSYNKAWNAEIITARSERIAALAWDVLYPWLSLENN